MSNWRTSSGWSYRPRPGAKLHHRDVIGVALRRMLAELHSDRSGEVVDDVFREVSGATPHGGEPPE